MITKVLFADSVNSGCSCTLVDPTGDDSCNRTRHRIWSQNPSDRRPSISFVPNVSGIDTDYVLHDRALEPDTATMSVSALSPNGEDQQHIRLACQACQRKKIKCDRLYPCTQCNRSSLPCVSSTRKPRARHTGKRAVDTELRNRITKLEGLVESLSGEVGLEDRAASDEPSNPTVELAESASSPTVGKYIGSPFWSSLTTEVQALRDALEDDQDEDDEPTSPTTSSSGANGQSANDYDLIMCPPGAIYVMPGALNEPPAAMQAMLYGIYVQNAAPMFKIHHIPTLRAFIERGAPYLGQDATALPNRAVKASLWFSAVTTLTEAECQNMFGQARPDLLQQYRRVVDVLVAQADLMNTNDMATLQAFVMTLVR